MFFIQWQRSTDCQLRVLLTAARVPSTSRGTRQLQNECQEPIELIQVPQGYNSLPDLIGLRHVGCLHAIPRTHECEFAALAFATVFLHPETAANAKTANWI